MIRATNTTAPLMRAKALPHRVSSAQKARTVQVARQVQRLRQSARHPNAS